MTEKDWTDGVPYEYEVRWDDVLRVRGQDWLRVSHERMVFRAALEEIEGRCARVADARSVARRVLGK